MGCRTPVLTFLTISLRKQLGETNMKFSFKNFCMHHFFARSQKIEKNLIRVGWG